MLRPRNISERACITQRFNRELETLRTVSSRKHECIIEFSASFKVPSAHPFGHYGLIFPFADGGNLHEFLRLPRIPAWLAPLVSRSSLCEVVHTRVTGLMDALAFVHCKSPPSKYLIHGDIKLSNILIHGGIFKLANFGVSQLRESEETSKTCWEAGTLMYAPPEHMAATSRHGRARDIWALGCVILEILVLLLYGFSDPPQVEIFEEEREIFGDGVKAFSNTMGCVESWIAKLWEMAHAAKNIYVDGSDKQKALLKLFNVMRTMLVKNPSDRITAAEARDYLASSGEPRNERILMISQPGLSYSDT